MRRRLDWLGVSWLGVVLCLTVLTRPALADEKIGLVPAHPDVKEKESFSSFRFELGPGESKSDEVAVVNLADEEMELELFPRESEASWVSGAWGRKVRVKPGERKKVPFKVEVPERAVAGDHVFSIVSDAGGEVEVLVLVKGGAKEEIRVLGIDLKTQKEKLLVDLVVENSGGVVIESLSLRLRLGNRYGVGVMREVNLFWPLNERILPGERKNFSLRSESDLPFMGKFEGDYEVDFGKQSRTGRVDAFWHFNWLKLGGYSLVLLLLAGLVLLLIRGLFKMLVRGIVSLTRISRAKKAKPVRAKRAEPRVDDSSNYGFEEKREFEVLLGEIRRIVREEMGAKLSRENGSRRRRNKLYVLR